MHQVLLYLLRSSKPLVPEEEIADMLQWEELEWQKYAEECKGMIVTNPGMVRPSLSVSRAGGNKVVGVGFQLERPRLFSPEGRRLSSASGLKLLFYDDAV